MSESEKKPLPRITDPKVHLLGHIHLLEKGHVRRLRAHVDELKDAIERGRLSADVDELKEALEQMKKDFDLT